MKILFIIQIMKLELGEVKGFVPNSSSMSISPGLRNAHTENIHGSTRLLRMGNTG